MKAPRLFSLSPLLLLSLLSMDSTQANETHLTYHTYKQYEHDSYPWHQSIELLWNTSFQFMVSRAPRKAFLDGRSFLITCSGFPRNQSQIGIWPFDSWANTTDFEIIFTQGLFPKYGSQSANYFDQDTWAQPFLTHGFIVLEEAKQIAKYNQTLAKATYL
jgi:hypothetical protein